MRTWLSATIITPFISAINMYMALPNPLQLGLGLRLGLGLWLGLGIQIIMHRFKFEGNASRELIGITFCKQI